MKKVGRLLKAHHQLCYAHGLQLAVLDVLYHKDTLEPTEVTERESDERTISQGPQVMENIEEVDENVDVNIDNPCDFFVTAEVPEEAIQLMPTYRDVVQKVRKIVKCFKSSPKKNDLLQTYIKAEFGKELQLILDCKTRWSSVASMIARFNNIKHCVSKALIDLNLQSEPAYFLNEQESNILSAIECALEPLKLAVNVLCFQDATLLSAETILRFLVDKIQQQNTSLSMALASSLHRRIKERRITLTGVLLYLENPIKYLEESNSSSAGNEYTFVLPSKAQLKKEIVSLLERLLINSDVSHEAASSSRSQSQIQQVLEEDEDDDIPLSHCTSITDASLCELPLEEQLEQIIRTKWIQTSSSSTQKPAVSLNLIIKREMTLYECWGNRGKYLEATYNFVYSIPPTSVESERAFSAAGYTCSKIRSNVKDETLNTLCILRKQFQKQVSESHY